MSRRANGYADIASSVIKDARDFCRKQYPSPERGTIWDPLIAALAPRVGAISQDSLENWVANRRSARADAVLAAADIANIDLTERLGARSIRQELADLKAEMAALRLQHEASAS